MLILRAHSCHKETHWYMGNASSGMCYVSSNRIAILGDFHVLKTSSLSVMPASLLVKNGEEK